MVSGGVVRRVSKCGTPVYYCCQSRFDFWLRHEEPDITKALAYEIDNAMVKAAESISYVECIEGDALTEERFRLPARRRGCGIVSREWLASIAYTSCFIESAEEFVGRGGRPGYFPNLEEMFGQGAFDPGGTRFSRYISSYASGSAFDRYWNDLRALIPNGATEEQMGPLYVDASQAGAGRGLAKLQKKITERLQEFNFRALDERMKALPRDDMRREAWLAVDRLSSQWVTAWPSHTFEFGHQEFGEVMTTYLGRESPVVRGLEGRKLETASAIDVRCVWSWVVERDATRRIRGGT